MPAMVLRSPFKTDFVGRLLRAGLPTLSELARRTGIGRSRCSNIADGLHPTEHEKIRIAAVLGCPVGAIWPAEASAA